MLDDRDNEQPTQSQIEAGNYPKGHVYAHGMRISIENPAGSIRTGKSEEWASRLQHDYGYVRGSTGRDGDHIDVFLGPEYKERDVPVHVIDQHDPDTGKFDEHKAMMGFRTEKDAVEAYHANYPADWNGAQAVTPLHVDEFKRWATSPGARHKALAEHLGVKRYVAGGMVKLAEGGAVRRFADGGWTDDFTPQSERTAPVQPDDPYTFNTSAPHPSQQQMADAWNTNRTDPSKVYQLMQQNGVGVNEVAKMLGVGNDDVAHYLNTGRANGTKTTGYGDDLTFQDQYKYGEVHPEAQTKTEFQATVSPDMLDANGRFKGPGGGVNYRYEGMTPDEVFAQHQPDPYRRPGDATIDDLNADGTWNTAAINARTPNHDTYAYYGATHGGTYGGGGSSAIAAPWDPINLKWEPGPDNGGGGVAGVGRAIGSMGTAVVNNPALMAALTAGISSYMAPASVAGDVASAGEMGGNTTNAALYGNAGYGAEPTALQSVMSSPYAQPVLNGAKTIAAGGSPADALKSAGATYAGNAAGSAVASNSSLSSIVNPNVIRYITTATLKGKKADPYGLASAYLTGQANTPTVTHHLRKGGAVLPELNAVVMGMIAKANRK